MNMYNCGLLLVLSTTLSNVKANTQYVVGGDNLTLSCRVPYVGASYFYESIEWKLNGCQPCGNTPSERTVYTAEHRRVLAKISELVVVVSTDAEYLPNYTCSITFAYYYNYYVRLHLEYSWTVPRIKVSCKYC